MAVDFTPLNANSIANINTNFQRVDASFQDALSRSGNGPNQMNADLDMNSNDLLNVNSLNANSIEIQGVPIGQFSGTFKGLWDNSTAYVINDVVRDPSGNLWIAKQSSTNQPVGENDYWTIFIPGSTVADGSVTTPKLANDSVTSDKLADDSVGPEHLQDSLVDDLIFNVDTRTQMKALDTNIYKNVFLKEGDRRGLFSWRTGDFSAKVTADTQEGVYIKANAVAATSGAWVRGYEGDVNILWFGVSNQDVASDAGIEAWGNFIMREQKRGYAPAGFYRHSGRWVIDTIVAPGVGSIMMRGDGAYKTIFTASSSLGDNFHIYKSGAPDPNGQKVHTYGVIEDMGFVGDCNGPVMTIGGNDLVDTAGNYNLRNVFIVNINSAEAPVSSLRLNYLFDCVFENIVAVGNVGFGDALTMIQCHFCLFNGGSYSNAVNGIVLNGANHTNTFLSADIENTMVGILNVTANDGNNIWISPYFDIYNPVTMVSGGPAIRSLNASVGGVVVENPRWVERAGNTLIDTANQVNVFVKGGQGTSGSVVTTPAFPASDVAVTNNTGRMVAVRFSNSPGTLTAVFINGEETQLTGGTVILRPRQSIAPRYTGAPVWRWEPLI